MELREDEIEAVLKFDGASLLVIKNEDLLLQGGHQYTAVIYINQNNPDPCVARGGESRVNAVRSAWGVYVRYKETPDEEKENGYWLYEQAVSKINKLVAETPIKTKQEKQNG